MSKILALHVNDKDTCVTVTEEVQPGDVVIFLHEGVEREIEAKDNIPIYHKIAIVDHKEGDFVYKYGYKIAIATKDISVGEHVHIHNVKAAGLKGVVTHSSADLSTQKLENK